jgi:Family of unknown function (DUF6644)
LLFQFAEWLAGFPASTALRESVWMYPVVESVHVLSLTMFVGTSVLWDMRLMGLLLKEVPITETKQRLMPWMMGGFMLMVASGAVLFFGDPVRFYLNIFFRIKAVLLAMAGLNAYFFHTSPSAHNLLVWDRAPKTPFAARLAGSLSLLLWAGVIVAGRLIAYNWFN